MGNKQRSPLYEHTPLLHVPMNVNLLHKMESEASGFNQRLALLLTRCVGTMTCAYLFTVLAILGFPGLHATPTQWVQWISQTLIQLVMLSVIMVGQEILGRKQAMQSDEQYKTTMKIYDSIDQLAAHLSAQDELLQTLYEKTQDDLHHG